MNIDVRSMSQRIVKNDYSDVCFPFIRLSGADCCIAVVLQSFFLFVITIILLMYQERKNLDRM